MPKKYGYRSLHRVYKYRSDNKKSMYNDMLIEIQFRTSLQHIWATAVETMEIIINEDIKSEQASPDILRFFALVSSLFAIQENQPIVPGTSRDVNELVKEIIEIDKRNHFLNLLKRIPTATLTVKKNNVFEGKYNYYLLSLNNETNSLFVQPFYLRDFNEANNLYKRYETKKSSSNVNTVLVQVSSFSLLEKAYPNYFSDVNQFINIVNSFLNPKMETK